MIETEHNDEAPSIWSRLEEQASESPKLPAPLQEGKAAAVCRQAGQGLASAARAAGRGIASGLRAVDPDVYRHAAELPLMGLTMLTGRWKPAEALAPDGQRPVIFVHGLGGKRGNFLPMQTWFRLHGRSRLYGVGLDGGSSIELLGERLRAFVGEVLAVNGLPADSQVDLVAHSMGGLVARCALEDPETQRRVACLVTLGTPHAGSHAARFLTTEQALGIRPDSPLLQRLAAQAPWTSSTRLICFSSRADVLVLPAESAHVEGAENHELEGLTHYGYLLRPKCWRRIADELQPAKRLL